MNLKKIERSSHGTTKEATLTISKIGVFSFNKSAMEQLPADLDRKYLDFFQDEDQPDCWYFSVVDKGSIYLRQHKDRALGSGKSIAVKIKESTRHDPHKTIRARVGKAFDHDGMLLYPVLILKGEVKY